ncbi:MAG: hypothetical protein LBI99_03585 [Propionibacteriaceae bacterium]|nr:hypothetical protein [Propionibacteriaceae bacterium]
MKAVVLNSQAVSLLADRSGGDSLRTVIAALAAARDEGVPVLVPAACLAELYRGKGFDQRTDAVLGRNTGIAVRDTDRELARTVGHLLSAARLGSAHHVDAAVVAASLSAGGGVIVTSDPEDLGKLAAGSPAIPIHAV